MTRSQWPCTETSRPHPELRLTRTEPGSRSRRHSPLPGGHGLVAVQRPRSAGTARSVPSPGGVGARPSATRPPRSARSGVTRRRKAPSSRAAHVACASRRASSPGTGRGLRRRAAWAGHREPLLRRPVRRALPGSDGRGHFGRVSLPRRGGREAGSDGRRLRRSTRAGPEPVLLGFVRAKDHAALAPAGPRAGESGSGRRLDRPHRRALSWGCCGGCTATSGTGAVSAIVLLTLVINVAMAPFRHYSASRTGSRWRGSPRRCGRSRSATARCRSWTRGGGGSRRRSAAFYAKHGMSMSTQMTVGCLPLLLTMPFLFAFYRVLRRLGRPAGGAVPVGPRPRRSATRSS